jgi:hypothetical protein
LGSSFFCLLPKYQIKKKKKVKKCAAGAPAAKNMTGKTTEGRGGEQRQKMCGLWLFAAVRPRGRGLFQRVVFPNFLL